MEEMGHYLQWLEAGKSPADIKQDLIMRGFSENDALDITKRIDEIFLLNKHERKVAEDGRFYKTMGWIVVIATLLISVGTYWYASSFGGWFILIGGGGGGFSFIRYGNYLESKDIIPRQRGFPRKFQRNR